MEAARRNYHDAQVGQQDPRGEHWVFLSKHFGTAQIYKMRPFGAILRMIDPDRDRSNAVRLPALADLEHAWLKARSEFDQTQAEVAETLRRIGGSNGGDQV